MNKVIGILIIFGLLCYSIYSGSKQYWPVFFDIPSFIIVTGLTFGFMVATVSKEAGRFCVGSFLGRLHIRKRTLRG